MPPACPIGRQATGNSEERRRAAHGRAGQRLAAASIPGEGPPTPVTADALRETVGAYWAVDEIRPARIHADVPDNVEMFQAFGDIREEGDGRTSVPGWLLSTHLA